ncbi:MAG: hypothetical protein DMF89_19920 [Acidobacteria bacterium]|nr:MAG: hypothetical protein DMF89_19920 [Acidobacteriota bacterium]
MCKAIKASVALALALVPTAARAQQPITAAIDISDEQVKAVNATPGVDRQLRIVDLGKYQLAVGIVHRGPTGAARGTAGRGAAGAGAQGRGAAVPCGTSASPASASSSSAAAGGIAHDATTETYIIVSGSGTLVTGGHIVNGTRSGPESEVTRVLNGPSCSGTIEGQDVVRRVVKTGDIIIIPAGVPHGWTDIADHVDYLSVRPDPDKVLQRDYVHPAISAKK